MTPSTPISARSAPSAAPIARVAAPPRITRRSRGGLIALMEITSIDHPIAERELQHSDGHTIRVIIGRPEPFPDGKDFFCPFQIIGLRGDKIRRAGGVD